MEKEFVNYEIALDLERIGFEEKCISVFLTSTKKPYPMYRPYSKKEQTDELLRPTFSQAFRWFREKYGYCSYIQEAVVDTYRFHIEKFDEKYYNSSILNSYEEAELECLNKLIKIVENI